MRKPEHRWGSKRNISDVMLKVWMNKCESNDGTLHDGLKVRMNKSTSNCTMDLKYKWIKVNCVLQRVNQSNECALDVGFKVQMNKS